MAGNIPSFEVVRAAKRSKCLSWPVFHSAWLVLMMSVAGQPKAQLQETGFTARHLSSHGLLDADHWIDYPLRASPRSVNAVWRNDLYLVYRSGIGELAVSRTTRGFYSGDSNVLSAMAQNTLPGAFPMPAPARYALQADSQQMVSHDLSLGRQFEPVPGLRWGGRIYLSYIIDYQRSLGHAQWMAGPHDSQLTGRIQRWGTRRYGYLIEDREDSGQAAGLDASVAWQSGPWQVHIDAENLWSRLRFSTLHFSDRHYDVLSRGNSVVIKTGNDFSMTGTYGLTTTTQRLPAWAMMGVHHQELAPLSAGVVKLNDRWHPWVRLRSRPGYQQWGLATVGGHNLTLESTWTAASGVQWGLGLTWARESQPAVGALRLRVPL